MTETRSPYGRILVGNRDELFATAVAFTAAQAQATASERFVWALTGGSTPAAFYRWCVDEKALPGDLLARAHFTVSDERHVLLTSPESNFGNAERLLLAPLGIPVERRHPWLVAWPVAEAAEAYRKTMLLLSGPAKTYDACFLGMGDDCHTASLFPDTPLLRDDGGLDFGGQEVPGKGWRLTITPTGLRRCGLVVVMALGAGKAAALNRVHAGAHDPLSVPAQILRECSDRVVWLVDPEAARLL